MKVRAPDRVQSGALTPEILWRHYAGNKVAPLRRQFTGSITPETKWLLNAESSQPPNMINNITGAVGSIDELATLMREEVKNLSKKDEELSDRMHSMEKLQHRVLLGLGILSVILVAATTVAVKDAYTSLFEKPKVNSVAVPALGGKASGVPSTGHQ
jgi:hypothetical protein